MLPPPSLPLLLHSERCHRQVLMLRLLLLHPRQVVVLLSATPLPMMLLLLLLGLPSQAPLLLSLLVLALVQFPKRKQW